MPITTVVREVPVVTEGGTRATRRGSASIFVVALHRPDFMDDVRTYRVRLSRAGIMTVAEMWLAGHWVEVGRYYAHTLDQAAVQAVRDITEGIEDEW